MHSYSDDVDRPTCKAILQVGYQLGERIVRPARVAVVEPEHAPDGSRSRRGSMTRKQRVLVTRSDLARSGREVRG